MVKLTGLLRPWLSAGDAIEIEGLFVVPFPWFAAYTTRHCVTGSLEHIYGCHGYPISEDLLLGLGCGLGFV